MTKTNSKPTAGEARKEIESLESLLNSFVEAEIKKKSRSKEDGEQNAIQNCFHALKALAASNINNSFDVYTFYFFTESLDLDFKFRTDFFNRAMTYLVKHSRAEEIQGCYSHNVFRLI